MRTLFCMFCDSVITQCCDRLLICTQSVHELTLLGYVANQNKFYLGVKGSDKIICNIVFLVCWCTTKILPFVLIFLEWSCLQSALGQLSWCMPSTVNRYYFKSKTTNTKKVGLYLGLGHILPHAAHHSHFLSSCEHNLLNTTKTCLDEKLV